MHADPVPSLNRPNVLGTAWRQLWRDWRAGELRLLVLAVSLAVAALCAVGFLADRLEQGLSRDAAKLLGGDAVVASDQPLPEQMQVLARSLQLQLARSVSFPSMARAPDAQGGASRLVAVKAVSSDYPLRGLIALASGAGQAGQSVRAAPERGAVWADAAVLDSLGLSLGDTLMLGDAHLTLTRIIVNEPARSRVWRISGRPLSSDSMRTPRRSSLLISSCERCTKAFTACLSSSAAATASR